MPDPRDMLPQLPWEGPPIPRGFSKGIPEEGTGEYRWKVIDKAVGEVHETSEIYNLAFLAESEMVKYVKEELGFTPRTADYEFEIISTPSGEVERVIKRGYISPTGEIQAATEYGPYY